MIDYDSADFAFGCGYFAVFVNRYFPKFRRFRTNLAEVTLIISYKQGTNAVSTAPCGRPASAIMRGTTASTYPIVAKIVSPAITSVPISV